MSTRNFILMTILEKNTSQSKIAQNLGRSKQAINAVINGTIRSAHIEAELARLCGIPSETLFPQDSGRGRRKAAA